MADREAQVAARFRADTALMAILLGKVWEYGKLGTEGITNPTTTPAVYSGGKLLPCCVIRQGSETDDPTIVDEGEQVVGEFVVARCWLYERITTVAIEAAKNRIYTLLQGYGLPGAWKAKRVFTMETTPAPEMVGVNVSRVDYQIRTVRRPVAA